MFVVTTYDDVRWPKSAENLVIWKNCRLLRMSQALLHSVIVKMLLEAAVAAESIFAMLLTLN